MMRWLFLGLIIVNVFYFIWTKQNLLGAHADISAADARVLSGHDQVKLLTEVDVLDGQSSVGRERKHGLFLGGFSTREEVKKLQQRLNSLDINSKIAEFGRPAYQVYLESLPSLAVSVRTLEELRVLKFDGSIIPVGELQGRIDLGVYQDKRYAQDLAQDVRDAGYPVLVRVVSDKKIMYWLDIDEHVQRLVGDELLEQLLSDFPGLKQLMRMSASN